MKYPDDFVNKIICGDCLEVMKEMPEECVNLVLTDPPYGQGRAFIGDDLSDKELYDYLLPAFKQIVRVVKFNVLVDAPKNKLPIFFDLLKSLKYEYLIILHTTNDMRQGKVGFSAFSPVLWFSKEKRPINRYRDLIKANLENTINHFRHPTPKNTTHYCQLIKMFSNENELVFDPFLGSGTTVEACKEMRRNFIGIEINPDYCKIAEKRLAQGVL